MPRPVEALPCGSESSSSTRSPMAESAVPRLIAVVVLPTPPFWLAMARTRVALASTSQAFHLQDTPLGVAEAGDGVARETPDPARLGDLGLGPAPLLEQADRAIGQMRFGEGQQPHQGRNGSGGDDVGLEGEVLGAVVVDLRRQAQLADHRLEEA